MIWGGAFLFSPEVNDLGAVHQGGGVCFSPNDRNAAAKVTVTELGFPVEVEECLIALEGKAGHHDLTRLKAREPGRLATISKMLARGFPVRDICELAGVSASTVAAVQEDKDLGVAVVTLKERLRGKVLLSVLASIETILESAAQGKVKDAFQVKLLFDMLQQLEGGTTVRHEHTVTFTSPNVKRAMDLLEGAGMGLGAGNLSALGAAAPGLGEGGSGQDLRPVREVVAVEVSDGVAGGEAFGVRELGDGKPDMMSKSGGSAGSDGCADLGGSDQGDAELGGISNGGGGGLEAGAGRDTSMHLGSTKFSALAKAGDR